MAYLTDRKRATGMGSSKTGTAHHWNMTISSYGLLVLVPIFVFTFGPILGAPYERVLEYFAHPVPSIVTGLMIVAGMLHFKNGMRSVYEDYTDGLTRELLIVATDCVAYILIGGGLFALARLAL